MVLRAIVRAGWPDQEPGWPAFLEGDMVLRVTDAEANEWLRQALFAAPVQLRYRQQNLPAQQPQPPQKNTGQ